MMDVITGKTRPDSGTACVSAADRTCCDLSEPEIAQAGIGRKFQKPTVFEQLTVFENLELALAGDKSFLKTLLARMTPAQTRRIYEVLEIIGLAEQQRRAGKNALARPEAVAGDRHAADAGAGTAAGRRAGRRHDPAGNRAHGRASAVARRRALGGGGRARHGFRSLHRQARHGAARRAACSPKAIWIRCRTIRASSKSISERERADDQRLSISFTAAATPCGMSTFPFPPVALMCLMGRNGMGKTTLLKCIMGLLPASFRQHHFRRSRFAQAPRRRASQNRHRLCAAGTRDFFASDGGGEPARGPRRAQERRARDSRPHLRSVPRAEARC